MFFNIIQATDLAVTTTLRTGLPYPPPLPAFSSYVQSAIKEGTLLQAQRKFIKECAHHLSTMVPYPSKYDYMNYCSALVKCYPEMKDENCDIPYVIEKA